MSLDDLATSHHGSERAAVNPTLLVVDDEESIVRIFRRRFEKLGWVAHIACGGDEALAILETTAVDLLITDITMPRMNGIELMRRAMAVQPELQCIVMTGYGQIETAVAAMRLGAINYFSKPVDFESLEMAIRKGLEKKQLQEELARERQSLRKANRELALAVNKNKMILDAAGDGIIGFDAAGRVTFANPAACRMLGWEVTGLLGQPLASILEERDAGAGAVCLHRQGHCFPVEYVLSPMVESGRAIGSVLVFNDVAERRQTEEELRLYRDRLEKLVAERTAELQDANDQLWQEMGERQQAEQEAESRRQQLIEADKLVSLGVLVAGVAHEINNPNTFIMMNAPILRRAWDDMQPLLDSHREHCGDFAVSGLPYSEMRAHIPELFAGIMEGAERIKQIVLSLKDYARKDVADLNQRVQINEVLKAALTLLANPLKKATHRLEVAYGEGLPPVTGNFQRIEQVLINVIQNGCQSLAGPDRGITIATSWDRLRNIVMVQVKDEGCGIPPRNLKHIKDPFFTTKRDSGGTGLGLSISAGIMEEHGGRLLFDSVVGEGTSVTIVFPAAGEP